MGWGVRDYPSPPDYNVPVCPICGNECEIIYKYGNTVEGCDQCIDAVDAWDYMFEMEEMEEDEE